MSKNIVLSRPTQSQVLAILRKEVRSDMETKFDRGSIGYIAAGGDAMVCFLMTCSIIAFLVKIGPATTGIAFAVGIVGLFVMWNACLYGRHSFLPVCSLLLSEAFVRMANRRIFCRESIRLKMTAQWMEKMLHREMSPLLRYLKASAKNATKLATTASSAADQAEKAGLGKDEKVMLVEALHKRNQNNLKLAEELKDQYSRVREGVADVQSNLDLVLAKADCIESLLTLHEGDSSLKESEWTAVNQLVREADEVLEGVYGKLPELEAKARTAQCEIAYEPPTLLLPGWNDPDDEVPEH